MGESFVEYGVILVAVMVVSFIAYSVIAAPGALQKSGANYDKYNSLQTASDGGCGDLRDEANVQHLSHHPAQYGECLRKVDAAFLQKATGQTLAQIMG